MTLMSAGLTGARRYLTLRVFGGGGGREGNVRAERIERGSPFEWYTIARFASKAEDVEKRRCAVSLSIVVIGLTSRVT